MLHVRADSSAITEADLDRIYNHVFGTKKALSTEKLVINLIDEQAKTCLTAPIGANFENKIVLAIAIRLAAETFMQKRLNDPQFTANIEGHQTQVLMEEFRRRFPGDAAISTLDRVII